MYKKLFLFSLFIVASFLFAEEAPAPTQAPNYLLEEETPFERNAPDFQESLYQMLTTLGILLAVVIATAYFLKRFLNQRMEQLNADSNIKILERRSLNPKSAIYLVEVEGNKILVGESASGLHDLGKIGSSFSEMMKRQP